MSDDWRLRVNLHDRGHAHELSRRLESPELEHDLERSYHDRVVVSQDGPEVFCYAGTREQAQRAQQVVHSLADAADWQLDTELSHWHPTAEAWEEPDKPLPASDAERAAEHRELVERERAESLAQGYPEFEVRVQCEAHHDALQLAERLRREGLPSVHRWRYLVIGALDEDTARALAARLRAEVPAGSTVTVEGNPRAILDETPNPFAVLGGLGG